MTRTGIHLRGGGAGVVGGSGEPRRDAAGLLRTGERACAIASRPQPLTFTLMAEVFKSFSILKVFHIKVAPPSGCPDVPASNNKPLVRISGAGEDAVSRSGSPGSHLKMLPFGARLNPTQVFLLPLRSGSSQKEL